MPSPLFWNPVENEIFPTREDLGYEEPECTKAVPGLFVNEFAGKGQVATRFGL